MPSPRLTALPLLNRIEVHLIEDIVSDTGGWDDLLTLMSEQGDNAQVIDADELLDWRTRDENPDLYETRCEELIGSRDDFVVLGWSPDSKDHAISEARLLGTCVPRSVAGNFRID